MPKGRVCSAGAGVEAACRLFVLQSAFPFLAAMGRGCLGPVQAPPPHATAQRGSHRLHPSLAGIHTHAQGSRSAEPHRPGAEGQMTEPGGSFNQGEGKPGLLHWGGGG